MSSVPSRAEWFGVPPPEGNMVDTHKVFGWKVHRHRMRAGTKLKIVSKTVIERDAAPNLAMYVGGLAVVTDDAGNTYPDRVPGMFTSERPDHPAGIVTLAVTEDVEFWCFNYTANKNSLPDLTPVRLAPMDILRLTKGQLLFVMKGSFPGNEFSIPTPFTFRAEEDVSLVATSVSYAFIIASEKI